MAQTRLTITDDALSLVITDAQSGVELNFKLQEEISMAEARALAAMVEHQVVEIQIEAKPDVVRAEAKTETASRNWHHDLVTCPCGKSFAKHGLGGLGKHATFCDHAKQMQVQGKHGTVYTPYLNAVESWVQFHPVTVKDIMNKFATLQVMISYSGVRTHLDHLVDAGVIESEKVGRGRTFTRVREGQ